MPRAWCTTAAYSGPVRIENGILVRDEPVLHGRTHDAAIEHHHIHVGELIYRDGTRRPATHDDAVVVPRIAQADPDDVRSGMQPVEAGFTCDFRRQRDGSWRGVGQDGLRYRLKVNGDNSVYRVLADEPGFGLQPVVGGDQTEKVRTAGGGVKNPEAGGELDTRSPMRRRAGDALLQRPDRIAGTEDHMNGLASWQAKLTAFWRKRS